MEKQPTKYDNPEEVDDKLKKPSGPVENWHIYFLIRRQDLGHHGVLSYLTPGSFPMQRLCQKMTMSPGGVELYVLPVMLTI